MEQVNPDSTPAKEDSAEESWKPKRVCKKCITPSSPLYDEIGDLSVFKSRKNDADKPAEKSE